MYDMNPCLQLGSVQEAGEKKSPGNVNSDLDVGFNLSFQDEQTLFPGDVLVAVSKTCCLTPVNLLSSFV